MKPISPEFQDFLNKGVTTLCWCWKVYATNGQTVGMTDHDQPLLIEGQSYKPQGLSGISVIESHKDQGTAFEILGALHESGIAETDLHKGIWQGAVILLMRVNWQNPDQRVTVFEGRLGRLQQEGQQFRADIESCLAGMKTPITQSYQKTCGAVFGGSRCGLTLTDPAWNTAGTVTAVSGLTITLSGIPVYGDKWFLHGTMTMQTGQNAGLKRMIQDFTQILSPTAGMQTQAIVGLGFPFPVQVGDQVLLTVGCDKTFGTCRDKFNNGINFRGCPALPGSDWMLAYPVQGQGNTGGRLT